jgi:hypothetical protein
MANGFIWSSDTSEEGLEYSYEYISTKGIFYGIHTVKFQYGDNPPIEATAKFDTGAKSSSIDYEVAKRMGVPQNLVEAADFIIKQEISKDVLKEEKDLLIKDLSEKHLIEVDTVKNATGITLRAYLPVTIYYNGRQIKTRANIANRSGLKAEALIGLSDMF